jgi:hypothetical protein
LRFAVLAEVALVVGMTGWIYTAASFANGATHAARTKWHGCFGGIGSERFGLGFVAAKRHIKEAHG